MVRTSLRDSGVITGFTGFWNPTTLNLDDKWCKCQYIVTARIFPSLEVIPGQKLVLDSQRIEIPCLTMENRWPMGKENAFRSGAVVPILMFDVSTLGTSLATLAASGLSLLLQIEARYNIQLEGDADIWFRAVTQDPVPSLKNAVRLRTAPMSLETNP
jgi:hypothetical protein